MHKITKEESAVLIKYIEPIIEKRKDTDTLTNKPQKTSFIIDQIDIINKCIIVILEIAKNEKNNYIQDIDNLIKNIKKETDNGSFLPLAAKLSANTINTDAIIDGLELLMDKFVEKSFSFINNESLFELKLDKLSKEDLSSIMFLAAFRMAIDNNDISWIIDFSNQEKFTKIQKNIDVSIENAITIINDIGLDNILQINENYFLTKNEIYFLSLSPVAKKTVNQLEESLLFFINNESYEKSFSIFAWHKIILELIDMRDISINKSKIKEEINKAKSIIYNKENIPQSLFVTEKTPILAIAGPGAGKTATLIKRVEAELKTKPINKLLILTFTNKAAEELKERLQQKINTSISSDYIGTFHSVFYKLIKKTVFSNWSLILPSEDNELFLNLLCKHLNATKKTVAAEAEITFCGKVGDLKGSVSKAIFSCLHGIEDIVDFCSAEYGDKFGIIVKDYLEKKHKMSVMNFDDVLRYTLKLLVTNSRWQEKIKNSFETIMVDEFQDTNKIQFAILSYISKGNNIIAVGDPYQSIYAFMNARIENVFDFTAEYKPNIIQMLLNYRSTGQIVELTNEITKHFETKIDTKMLSLKPTEAASIITGAKTKIQPTTEREKTTYELICQDIEDGYHPGDIAVITRLNRDSSKLEKLLTKGGIPFKKRGGSSFFERKESQLILNALRFYIDRYSTSSFEQVALFMENIGNETVDAIIDLSVKYMAPITSSLIYDNSKDLKSKRRKEVVEMLKLFEAYKEVTFDDFIVLLNNLKIIEKLVDESSTKAAAEEIKENAIELIDDIRGIFKSEDVESSVEELILMLSSKNSTRSENKAITITTAHSSKGLEWKKVYIMDISAGNFTECRQDMFEINDEQIRLLYVAISRAKDELVLIYQTHTLNNQKKSMDKILLKIWKEKGDLLFDVPDRLLKTLPQRS